MNSLQRQRLLKADAFAFEPLNVASKHVSIIPSLFHANRQTTRGMYVENTAVHNYFLELD
jgi:hypothetical protein